MRIKSQPLDLRYRDSIFTKETREGKREIILHCTLEREYEEKRGEDKLHGGEIAARRRHKFLEERVVQQHKKSTLLHA